MGQVPRDDNNIPLVSVASQGYVTASSSNATATTGGVDYVFSWASPVNHIMLQNNSGANISWELDAVTTGGSPILATGQTLFLDVRTSALHLQSAAGQNVNGTSSGNVVVRAWT